MRKVKYKNKSIIFNLLNSRIAVLISNVVFQGLMYMSLGEKIYKLSITFMLALWVNMIAGNIFYSLVVGHVLNYIINGQFYVVYRYLSSNKILTRKDLDRYILLIENLISLLKPLDVLVIGSFCRGKMRGTSDLDIRIYHGKGVLLSLKAYILATMLRFMGLLMRFPIDVFCFSNMSFLDKIRRDEIPVNFLQNIDVLQKYPESPNYKKHVRSLLFL